MGLPSWVAQFATDLGVIAGILGALALIHRIAVKPLLDIMRRIQASVEYVEQEFRPNGGSSLRDAVDRLEHQHGVLSTRLDVIDARFRK